ncbi:DUF507 family protein [Campylobacter sp. CX2-4080-23]|uniref:DUF507 family protein n=1 Tax=Campylobacter porcelli TaxID=1660073 RepID=UPI002EB0ECF2|nr:DUF507 family protein [Campylobacter sp. CX2-4080-23]
MRIKLPHAPYIARKIAIDLLNSGFIKFKSGTEPIAAVAKDILCVDINKERALEERVKELLDQNENEIDFMQVDRKSMFWLIKKKLAKDFGVMLAYDDRYSSLSHEILQKLWKDDLIDYEVSENRVKNLIYNAIESYLKQYEAIEDSVIDCLENYKKKVIPGTDEYDLIFEKLYEEELRKRGMI